MWVVQTLQYDLDNRSREAPVKPLTIPRRAAERIAAEARLAGSRPTETGGFLLSVDGGPSLGARTSPASTASRRGRDLLHVGGLALASLFEWADAHELTVAAQWHTHRLRAFLSDTDLRYGLNVPGFRTAVVPNYRRASSDPVTGAGGSTRQRVGQDGGARAQRYPLRGHYVRGGPRP